MSPKSLDAIELASCPPTNRESIEPSRGDHATPVTAATKNTQLTLAVVMLIAVIVLACVLVWVIHNNLSATSGTVNSTNADRTAVGLVGPLFNPTG